jgi:DNA-binding MarR family transcriptional regulator
VAAGITDITLAQARVAARIGPQGTRVSDLAEQARVTKQSAAFLVEQLEAAGYVERVRDPTDGRARLVRLTTRARRVAEAADSKVQRVLVEWADHVGEDRLRQMHETLRDLREITDPWH